MKMLSASLVLATLPGGVALSTQYKPERALRMEIEAVMKLETTTNEIEVNGERQEPRGGMSLETTRREVHVDRVIEAQDGKPAKVQRSFEKVGGKLSVTFGENSNDSDLESPLEGVTLEITRSGEDKLDVSVAEGSKPDDKALAGHLPENFLDALLPEDEVAVDGTWDLDNDAVKRALRLDVGPALFPPPERPEGGGDQGGGRRRGGMGSMGFNLQQNAEWTGKAKLVATDKDHDGVACAVIEIKLEASGEQAEPEFRGRRERGQAWETGLVAPPAAGTTYTAALEGKLYFALKEKRPVELDLEGTAKIERNTERTGGERTMKIHSVQEGTVTFKVAVSEEAEKGK